MNSDRLRVDLLQVLSQERFRINSGNLFHAATSLVIHHFGRSGHFGQAEVAESPTALCTCYRRSFPRASRFVSCLALGVSRPYDLIGMDRKELVIMSQVAYP